MSERISLTMHNAVQGHTGLMAAWRDFMKPMLTAGHRLQFEIKKQTRSIAQNKIMWSCLGDLSEQVEWFGKRMTPDGWKCWITGHLNGQELHPNMDGTGFISVTSGQSTSNMTIKEMIAVVDLCHAFGADKGVKWKPTSLGRDVCDPETGEIYQ